MVNSLAELFHVSAVERNGSWQPSIKRRTWDDPAKEAIEAALDAAKPSDAPSRRISHFAFPTIEECAYFADREKIEKPRYYRVRLPQPFRAPLTLNFVPDDLAAYAGAIYKHYWRPDDGWRLYEYFGEQMVVRGEYTDPIPEFDHIMNRVMDDRKRLRELAPTWV